MPSFVITEKCDGCKGGDKTACMYICPVDLMKLDKDKMKAFNQDPSLCWECYNCVKICPQQAIDVRGYADNGLTRLRRSCGGQVGGRRVADEDVRATRRCQPGMKRIVI